MAAPQPEGSVTTPPSKPPASRKLVVLVLGVVLIVAGSIAAFILLSTPPAERSPTRFEVSASDPTPFAGRIFTLTVRALSEDGSVATNYRGEVTFTSDDVLADLPPPTRFEAADQGVKEFPGVIVRKVGSVTVTARDTGLAISGSVALTAERVTGAPIATFDATRSLMHVDVDASASTDPDNDIASYQWDFENDGTFDASGVGASHDYATPGLKIIRLRVTDAQGNEDHAPGKVTVAASTIDYEFYDFFNVPFEDYWDIRQIFYFERPINAECFNATSIAQGICEATNPSVPDAASYPYTHWWSANAPGVPSGIPFLYARYRIDAQGVNVPGYSLSEPVYIWVRNYAESPGNRFDLTWRMSYINQTRENEIGTWCATNFVFGNDGYILESNINITMDLQESRRIFGVVGADPAAAQTWWNSVTNPLCSTRGTLETALENWFVDLGGSILRIGKYDIATGFEWYYQPFTINVNATVDPGTGLTWVNISHAAYGTEVLMARWLYWGNASYQDNWADSTRRLGWIGMEIAWYEDFVFDARLGPATHDFTLSTTMAYHFQNVCTPGPNGEYDRTDDVSVWTWGPQLDDYVHDWQANHPISELDRYTTETYVQCAAGSPSDVYGTDQPIDVTPITWDLPQGHTWTFRFPAQSVVFYDPNLTPPGAIPHQGQIAEIHAPLQFGWTTPSPYGDWDPDTVTWTVLGPTVTGGPDGSPGSYALQPWPTINFVRGPSAGLAPSGSAPGSPSSLAASYSGFSGTWLGADAQGPLDPFAPLVRVPASSTSGRETWSSRLAVGVTSKGLWNLSVD